MKLDFNDILIVPAVVSEISSRSEIEIYYINNVEQFHGKHLPLIAAPMDTVVDEDTIKVFEKLNINYCIPRGCNIEQSTGSYSNGILGFKSYSLDEFIEMHINQSGEYCDPYILIDIANGHMEKLYNAIKSFRKKYSKTQCKLMVGNVANPETCKILSEVGADYIRIGIGNGGGCLTTQQTGVGYPMASLIKECYDILSKVPYEKRAKIVADGGMKSYSDIIKALALGADYVMVGSIFNKALDSAGPTTIFNIKINQHSNLAKWLYNKGFVFKKKFRGMSTKEVQAKWNKTNLKTSEGVSRIYKVEYTLESWTKNFTDYLKSSMSYTDKKNLLYYIGGVNIINISDNAFQRFKK